MLSRTSAVVNSSLIWVRRPYIDLGPRLLATDPSHTADGECRPACDRRSARDLRVASLRGRSSAQLTGLVPPLTVPTLEPALPSGDFYEKKSEMEISRRHQAR